jgi:hypothetical protein
MMRSGRFWLALATAAMIGGCGGSSEGSVQIGPFGKWVTDAGHALTVNVDGTYRICRADSCSSGSVVNRNETYLEAVLRDFLAKPEAADLVPVIRECLDLHDGLTGGAVRRGLSADDLPFDAANNVLNGPEATQTVSFDCTEGARRVEFVKVETFPHPALADQQGKGAKARESAPPPTVRP